MVGLIESQQAIQHSSTVEKVQQVKQENLAVYQEVTTTEKKDKELRKQKTINRSKQAEDAVIRDKNRQPSGRRQKKKDKGKPDANEEQSGTGGNHKLDVLA